MKIYRISGGVRVVKTARERLRPKLPECWKCGSPHWPDEPCDDTPKAVKAIDKEEVERARRDISDAVPFIALHGRELEDS